jgi:transcriptional regulator with XRE-family HTH domain
MRKTINTEALREALASKGWTQSRLAAAVGVSSQSVTNWLKGMDFPRPATLLKLATTLKLGFDQLVQTSVEGQPIVAFRKKAATKTTDDHVSRAIAIGMLLKPLVPYLSEIQALRTFITSPSTDYTKLQIVASQTRVRLGVGEHAVLGYEHLIREFRSSGAVLVPVLWGAKKQHKNALHIRLPQEDVTFIFLNLDTHLEDFKFWMAHELAHVYTPGLAGTNTGEDFADALACALLFPKTCAETAYREAIRVGVGNEIAVLKKYATEYAISLNTVYQAIKQYAQASGLPGLRVPEKIVHAVRNSDHDLLVSAALFEPAPPEPKLYLAACEHIFQSDFFSALKRMIRENGTGAGFVQQILDVSIHDAMVLHEELRH